MAQIKTFNKTHDDTCAAAEAVCTAAVAAAGTQAAIRAAEITKYKAFLASDRANNNGANASVFIHAIQCLYSTP